MGYKIEPTGFRMSLTKKCTSSCFLCIGFRFYLLVIGFTSWLLGLILAFISIRKAEGAILLSANVLLVVGSLLMTLGVAGWVLYLWDIELNVRASLFKRLKQKEACSRDVTAPQHDVNGTSSNVAEMTNGVNAVPVPVGSQIQDTGATKNAKRRQNRKVEPEKRDMEKTAVHPNRTSPEMTVPLLAESGQDRKPKRSKALKKTAVTDAREPEPVSMKDADVTKRVAGSKVGSSSKQSSVVPVPKQQEPVPLSTTVSPLPKGNASLSNKVSPESRKEAAPKANTSQTLEGASKPPTLIERTMPTMPLVSPISKDSVQRQSAPTVPKQMAEHELAPKLEMSAVTIKPAATNTAESTPPKDPDVSINTTQKGLTATKRKKSKSQKVPKSKVSPTPDEETTPEYLAPEVPKATVVSSDSETKEIASVPFTAALSVPEAGPAVPKSTTSARSDGSVVRKSTEPKAAVHKPTAATKQKQFKVPKPTESNKPVVPDLELLPTPIDPEVPTPASEATAVPKSKSKEKALPKHVSKENVVLKPGSKGNIVPKPRAKETADPEPGSKETAATKPGSKETTVSKESTDVPTPGSSDANDGLKPGLKENVLPKPGSEKTAVRKRGSKETAIPKPGSKANAVPKLGSRQPAATKPGSKETAVPKLASKETDVQKPGSKETTAPTPGSTETVVSKPGSKENPVPHLSSKETAVKKHELEESVVQKPGSKEVPKPGSKEGSLSESALISAADGIHMASVSKHKDKNEDVVPDHAKIQGKKASDGKLKKNVNTGTTDQKRHPGKGRSGGLNGTRPESGKVTKDKLKSGPKSKKKTAKPAVNSAELKKVMVEARSKWGPTRGSDNCLAVLAVGETSKAKGVEKGNLDKREKPRRISTTGLGSSGSDKPPSPPAKEITDVSI